MFDNIMLLIGALFTAIFGLLFISLNTANDIGPYFVGGICLVFSVVAIYVACKYWEV